MEPMRAQFEYDAWCVECQRVTAHHGGACQEPVHAPVRAPVGFPRRPVMLTNVPRKKSAA